MTITRRELAKGTAWAAPVILASSIAPAYAASAGKLDITFSNHLCRNPGQDSFTHVNLVNNTSAPITLRVNVVLRIVISNPNRSRNAPSSTIGTQTCNDSSSTLTGCADVLWTLSAGTVFNPGQTINMAWHLLLDLGDGAHYTVTQISGGGIFSNPSTASNTQGYSGGGGCYAYGDF